MIEVSDIVKVIGLFLSLSVMGWGVIRWLLGRIEARYQELHRQQENANAQFTRDIGHLHNRVDEVKDSYVRRTDLDRDHKAMERRFESLEKTISESRAETNTRLDRMLMLLGKLIKDSSSPLE